MKGRKVDLKDKIANAQWILEKNLSWIASADVKAGVIITLNIAMLGGLAATYSNSPLKICWAQLFTILAAALEVLSTAFTAAAIFPRLKGPKKSLIFFGKITDLTFTDFDNQLKNSSDEIFLNDLSEQIYRNAEIANEKHLWVKKATITSFISSIAWVLAIIILVTYN